MRGGVSARPSSLPGKAPLEGPKTPPQRVPGGETRSLILPPSGRSGRQVALRLMAGLWLALLGGIGPVEGHPISLTSLLLNVEETQATAELSMFVEDLILYYWMETDGNLRFPRAALEEQAIKHQEFLLRHIHLRNRDGNRLIGRVVDIDVSELEDEGVHIDELMAYSIRYRFEYSFDTRPDFLTLLQDFGGVEPSLASEMRVRFFHHGVQMEVVGLGHGAAHTLRLDWDAGWERAHDDLEAARQRLRQRREEALGITSYSAVYSYVYLTDTEVRHEILIPLLTLESWLPLPRQQTTIMTVEEQARARDAIFAFLARHNRIEIDGEPVEPTLVRLDFFGPEFQDFARSPPARDVSVYNARVGLILSFPTEAPPETLGFKWDSFDPRHPVFRPRFFVFEEDPIVTTLERSQPRFEWRRTGERESVELLNVAAPPEPPLLPLPLGSIAAGGLGLLLGVGAWVSGRPRRRLACGSLAAALLMAAFMLRAHAPLSIQHPLRPPPAMTEEEAHAVFQALHQNIYRAFSFRTEDRIYDALEQSVAGPLLEKLYLQIRQNLTVQEQGGAVSRIGEIQLIAGERKAAPATRPHPTFAYHSTWTVDGTVEHWGHIHRRKNEYQAVFMLEGTPSGWRIVGFEPLREQRIEQQVSLRQ
jgi:hypothetical protein